MIFDFVKLISFINEDQEYAELKNTSYLHKTTFLLLKKKSKYIIFWKIHSEFSMEIFEYSKLILILLKWVNYSADCFYFLYSKFEHSWQSPVGSIPLLSEMTSRIRLHILSFIYKYYYFIFDLAPTSAYQKLVILNFS